MEKWEDQIVTEVRQIRERYAERFGFDVRAICHDLKKRQEEGSRLVIRRRPRSAEVGSTTRE